MGGGLAKGDGGLPDLFGHLSVPGFVSDVGECAGFAWGAVSPVIKSVPVLGNVRASPDDERAGAWLAVGMDTCEGALVPWFAVKERVLVVGSGEGVWSADRDDGCCSRWVLPVLSLSCLLSLPALAL